MSRSPPSLLFLAFPFPPSRAIGAVRCANLAKYLTRLGWRTTVVTIDPDLLESRDDSFPELAEAWCRDAGIERVLTGHEYRMLYGGALAGRWWERFAPVRRLAGRLARWSHLDPGIGWIRPAMRVCEHYRPGDFDVILASGPPYPAFEAACRIGRRLEAGVVLDYRDLWSMAPHGAGRIPSRIVRTERNLLAQAVGIWTVSLGMARCMTEQFGQAGKFSVITNGYDPDEYREISPRVFAQPTLVYAGAFYPPLRVIHPVLEAIGLANRSGLLCGKEIRLLYLGPNSGHVVESAKARGVLPWVDVGGEIPRREVLAALKGALASVVITSVQDQASPEVDSILTGKLFEAMGAQSPVLLVAPPQTDAARLVEKTGTGRAFAGAGTLAMADWIRQLACGSPPPGQMNASDYSWPEIARKADAALRKAVAEAKLVPPAKSVKPMMSRAGLR